ncbi:cytochrome c biogenesis protein ResB [Corynebacterium sp. ES2794-CONJ1]|uniref:cytochrome c biogenesis protein ResB n=1 Tax=unclassified Corynebacterium TaxID=2624378 RepID=UPI002166F9C4|nr:MULTISPECIES: cytochrome c biogenesis protein ResB [unclassified Corynebacterium]MCS4489708.1 cytochrome c biogenesis protein ResB [Corynebacterium sp. ES2775-CONJ]MCS4491283.1 cytochrome c biogenesis protein ResB [Corynebacterium sp. ES2715-CONJ3]MCS4531620.1 cytochrome c biogenesis protein ResB [Corynebacterium sp. ES2730-CONJ]MCU9519016.1 cytochrome c biogenesis protein ResB [Corynebacterium sp. ES2794-CONJ1]
MVKKAWQWLTSMRTALALLCLLAIAAIPGALLPQRSLNAANVDEYLIEHGRIAEIYDRLQLFDVFSSTWFKAIAVLLTISLIGCIIPRSIDHYQAMRTPPTRAPKNLHRLPLHGQGVFIGTEAQALSTARAALKGWNIAEYSPADDRAHIRSIAAEKGYIREFFNLIFHIALVGMLVAMAIGRMVYYEGQVIIIATDKPGINSQFCNTATANFDSFRAGPLFDGTGLHPFCFTAHNFVADYLPNGQAENFRSDLSYAIGDDIFRDESTWASTTLEVNHPLRIAGDRIYLQGHGYAPTIKVIWPNGEERTQTVQFRPDDPTFFLSSGVMRFDPPVGMYDDLFSRRQNQLTIQGLFAPTAAWSGENNDILASRFPEMRDPAVAIDIYRGDNGLDSGQSQSIFAIDPTLMSSGQLQKIERVNLAQGEDITLDDGTIIRFEGAEEFANYQIAYDPTQIWVLLFTLIFLSALVGSVTIKRRRIWVRVHPQDNGTVLIETAGLARTDRAGWGEEYYRIHRRILGLAEPEDEDS